jgi:hypothetical protein
VGHVVISLPLVLDDWGNSPILAALPGPMTIALLATPVRLLGLLARLLTWLLSALLATLARLLCLLARLLTWLLSALLATLARLLALLTGIGLTLFGVRTAFFALAHHCVSFLFKVRGKPFVTADGIHETDNTDLPNMFLLNILQRNSISFDVKNKHRVGRRSLLRYFC